jgi:RHS repeat-associated protein
MMTGISSKVLSSNYIENKKEKFQEQEFNDDLDVNCYEFKWRFHDPQIGRFMQIDPLADKYEYNSTYAFSENKVVVHRELEGLESAYIFARAKQELAATFRAAANWVDKNLSWGNKTTVETPVTPKGKNKSNTMSSSTTTTLHTNFGEKMDYIIRNNTNEGSTAPLIKTETKTDVSVGTKVEIKTPVASGNASATVDQNGTATASASATVKTNRGVDVGLNVSQSSNGDQKVGMTVSTGVNNTTVKVNGTGTANGTTGSGNVQFNFIFEQKKDNTKVSNTTFIRIGH